MSPMWDWVRAAGQPRSRGLGWGCLAPGKGPARGAAQQVQEWGEPDAGRSLSKGCLPQKSEPGVVGCNGNPVWIRRSANKEEPCSFPGTTWHDCVKYLGWLDRWVGSGGTLPGPWALGWTSELPELEPWDSGRSTRSARGTSVGAIVHKGPHHGRSCVPPLT